MRCLGCNYELKGLAENRCPECGRGFDPGDPATVGTEKSYEEFRWERMCNRVFWIVMPAGTAATLLLMDWRYPAGMGAVGLSVAPLWAMLVVSGAMGMLAGAIACQAMMDMGPKCASESAMEVNPAPMRVFDSVETGTLEGALSPPTWTSTREIVPLVRERVKEQAGSSVAGRDVRSDVRAQKSRWFVANQVEGYVYCVGGKPFHANCAVNTAMYLYSWPVNVALATHQWIHLAGLPMVLLGASAANARFSPVHGCLAWLPIFGLLYWAGTSPEYGVPLAAWCAGAWLIGCIECRATLVPHEQFVRFGEGEQIAGARTRDEDGR
ncbi:MAG TPA: hypothetical protein VG711_03065 [Phycisphaerales bacterium]|nr:hypothetical protein [Phycisphaerales bacterium]